MSIKNAGEQKTPLFHIVKRGNVSSRHAWMVRAIAFFGALLIGSLLILILGHNPIEVYASMINGAFGKKIAFQETIKLTIPLLITGIALAFAFQMKFWNIGAEGQILMGATAAMAVEIYAKSLPQGPKLALMFLAAVLVGGLYGIIPAIFKAKWNTNETLFTLMMNYIAIQVILFLQYQASWQAERTTFPKIRTLSATARLPKVFGIHIGWIIALAVVILSYLYMKKTKQGYEISVVGESPNTARYAGMNVSKIMIRTMFLSAALCGLVGFLQISGVDGTLTENTANGVGFTAITVAWLSHMNPFAMVLVSLFIAFLERGSSSIQTTHGIPSSAASLLTGLILFFMLGCEFFINYQVVFREKKQKKSVEKKGEAA